MRSVWSSSCTHRDRGAVGTAARPAAVVSESGRTAISEVDKGRPPRKPKDDAPLGDHHAWREQRRRRSSAHTCADHTSAEYKQWRSLQR